MQLHMYGYKRSCKQRYVMLCYVTVMLIMPQLCYSCVTVMLQLCYSYATVKLQLCYSCVTVMLQLS